VRTARIALVQTEGSRSPAAGDTIRLALFMSPEQDTIRGVEVFLGVDNTLLQTLGTEGPFERSGLTEGVDLQVNVIEDPGSTNAAAHFSVFFVQDKRASDTLAVIRVLKLEQIKGQTSIRVLAESPLSRFSRDPGSGHCYRGRF